MFEYKFENPLEPKYRNFKIEYVDGKIRRTSNVMGPDGVYRDYYTSFDGKAIKKLKDANIRYVTINTKSRRYKIINPMINVLQYMISFLRKLQSPNFTNSRSIVHVDAPRIEFGFDPIFTELDIKLPFSERLYQWCIKHQSMKLFGGVIKKYIDGEKIKSFKQLEESKPDHKINEIHLIDDYGNINHIIDIDPYNFLTPIKIPDGIEYPEYGDHDTQRDFITDFLQENVK